MGVRADYVLALGLGAARKYVRVQREGPPVVSARLSVVNVRLPAVSARLSLLRMAVEAVHRAYGRPLGLSGAATVCDLRAIWLTDPARSSGTSVAVPLDRCAPPLSLPQFVTVLHRLRFPGAGRR